MACGRVRGRTAAPSGRNRLAGPSCLHRTQPHAHVPRPRNSVRTRALFITAQEAGRLATGRRPNPPPPGQSVECYFSPSPSAGSGRVPLGELPDPLRLRSLLTFTPSSGKSPMDILADAALGSAALSTEQSKALHEAGPYNPAAALPPKIVKRILSLEIVEMSDLWADIWPDDPSTTETPNGPRRPEKLPVTNIRSWLECFGRMAAVLATRFPEKAPELWAYQISILHAAHTYEGANWVAYDRLYRREMLAKKDLNWSMSNPRLYSEAFTGRAKRHPQCPHCLSEDHAGASCPHNPNPPVVGWFQGSLPPQPPSAHPTHPLVPPQQQRVQEVCHNFNANRCRFTRCRFLHICFECAGAHAATHCPLRQGTPATRPTPTRGRLPPPARSNRQNPYPPPLIPPADTR